jgi:hypothetical protein
MLIVLISAIQKRMKMWTKDKALEYLIDFMKSKHYQDISLIERNKFGHAFIKSEERNVYFLYKHDQFHSFSNIFKEYVRKKNAIGGIGESINVEYLKKAIKTNSDLVFAYRNTPFTFYTPSREKLLNLLELQLPHENFREFHTAILLKLFCSINNLHRTQDRTNTYKTNDYTNGTIVVNEKTFSFPFKLMARFL